MPVGAVSPAGNVRPGPCWLVDSKSGCPMTRSALAPLAKLVALRHASTRLLLKSLTYRMGGVAEVSMATPMGRLNSLPSTRLGAPDGGTNATCPTLREGELFNVTC